MKKTLLLVLLMLLAMICACTLGGGTSAWQSVCGLVVRDDGKIIPIVYYELEKQPLIRPFTVPAGGSEQAVGIYFAEANVNDEYYTIIKKAEDYLRHEFETLRVSCVFKNGIYAMQTGYDQYNINFFDAGYKLKNTINLKAQPVDNIYDLTIDGSRFIYQSNTGWYEYNTKTSSSAVVSSTAIPAGAKYSPMDETVIYYFIYPGPELHSIKSDGSNDQLILSGYYINHITFNPAGDKIIFSTYDKVYSVNLDGTAVTEMASYTLPNPNDIVLFSLSYNKIVYVDRITQNAIQKIDF